MDEQIISQITRPLHETIADLQDELAASARSNEKLRFELSAANKKRWDAERHARDLRKKVADLNKVAVARFEASQ